MSYVSLKYNEESHPDIDIAAWRQELKNMITVYEPMQQRELKTKIESFLTSSQSLKTYAWLVGCLLWGYASEMDPSTAQPSDKINVSLLILERKNHASCKNDQPDHADLPTSKGNLFWTIGLGPYTTTKMKDVDLDENAVYAWNGNQVHHGVGNNGDPAHAFRCFLIVKRHDVKDLNEDVYNPSFRWILNGQTLEDVGYQDAAASRKSGRLEEKRQSLQFPASDYLNIKTSKYRFQDPNISDDASSDELMPDADRPENSPSPTPGDAALYNYRFDSPDNDYTVQNVHRAETIVYAPNIGPAGFAPRPERGRTEGFISPSEFETELH